MTIHHATLPSGLTLLAEPIPGAKSLSMQLLTPAGNAAQPDHQQGVAALLAEMICRGAGGKSAREHNDALETLGVQRSTHNASRHLSISAAMIGEKLPEALPLLLDMARHPALDADSLEPSRDLALQSIDALADEPQQRALIELRHRHFADPFGRSSLGIREHVEKLTLQDVRKFWYERMVAGGSILAFAGDVDWETLQQQVTDSLGDWNGQAAEIDDLAKPPRGYHHVETESSQVHVGLAYDAPAEPDEEAIYQRAAAAVLSGGMSGRLFTEVREKRGLCYAVYGSYAGQRDRGAMLGYAGTTTPRAQETLDVMVQELHRLSQGATQSEFDRAVVGMKSRLVMSGESTSARASALAADQYNLGRPRTLDERAAEVDALTLDGLNRYLAQHPPGEMTIITIGPQPLTVPETAAVS